MTKINYDTFFYNPQEDGGLLNNESVDENLESLFYTKNFLKNNPQKESIKIKEDVDEQEDSFESDTFNETNNDVVIQQNYDHLITYEERQRRIRNQLDFLNTQTNSQPQEHYNYDIIQEEQPIQESVKLRYRGQEFNSENVDRLSRLDNLTNQINNRINAPLSQENFNYKITENTNVQTATPVEIGNIVNIKRKINLD